jgi:hypothetical protein
LKHGFLAGYKERGRGTPSSSNASVSLTELDQYATTQGSSSDGNGSQDQFTLSREQYQNIMALLQQSQPQTHSANSAQTTSNNNRVSSSSFHWILDSGATDHICPSKSCFLNLFPITPISVKMPNQTSVIANFSGTVQIGSLFLHNILYITEFSVYLISIPKLVCDPNYLICFCHNDCLILQRTPFQKIGLANKIKGLFYLKDFAASLVHSTDVSVSQFTAGSFTTCNNYSFSNHCNPVMNSDKAFLWHTSFTYCNATNL